jgi:2-phosphoglycerate kinase
MADKSRSWEVLLIGGASGVGKTSISYRIAQHFGIGITEIDDIVVALKRMTTPEQQPILHYWDNQHEPIELSPKEIVKLTVAVSEVMLPALEAVIANHLESQPPIPLVLEGDYLLPELAAQPVFSNIISNGRVRAVFLYEPDEAQIVANYLQREPDEGKQNFRAHVSWLFGEWLRLDAERLGVTALSARPWDTLFERVLNAIR